MKTVGAASLQATLELIGRFRGASLDVLRRESSIVVTPTLPDTFSITLYDHGDDAMIAATRWHTHHDDPEQAAWGVLWLLTPYYRLVHELKGGVLVAGWLERYEETGWEPFDPVYFLPPDAPQTWVAAQGETFARRYHQQGVLPSPLPYAEFCPGAELDEQGLPPDFHHGTRIVEVTEPLGPALSEL